MAKEADIEEEVMPGVISAEFAEVRDLKHRNRLPRAVSGGVSAGVGVVGFPRGRPTMMVPLVRDFAADGVPIVAACRVLRFTKRTFYTSSKRPYSDQDCVDAHLTNAAFDVHRDRPSGIGCSPTSSSWPGMSRRSVIAIRKTLLSPTPWSADCG
ncbi:hypothetical protein HQQ80_16865 [Microbacteriaceae bacterium VKM Ac-2855]|nr:hypothetical protein [Microbacteriaceae bacterium VKM Ac-2855]